MLGRVQAVTTGLYRRHLLALLTFGGYTGATRRRPRLSVACARGTTPCEWTGALGFAARSAFAAWSVTGAGALVPEPQHRRLATVDHARGSALTITYQATRSPSASPGPAQRPRPVSSQEANIGSA